MAGYAKASAFNFAGLTDAGNAENDLNEGVRWVRYDLPENISVDANSPSNHREKEQNADQDHHAIGFQSSKRTAERVG